MELREQKALHIAATTSLAPDRGRWKVPSQSGKGNYAVMVLSDGSWSCTCPDWEERLDRCKHVMAVEITLRRETGGRASEFSEVVKMTYSQDWSAYNASQCNEKRLFLRFLTDLCAGVPQPEYVRGRPRLPIADMVTAHVHKCYVRSSARRFTSDLVDAADKGLIDQVPSFNSVLRYGADESMTPVLTDLIALSASPLAAIETNFAADSTGFGASKLRTWYSTKHGRELTARDWRKLHAMVGVQTHIITAAQVSHANANDAPFLAPLTAATAKMFDVREVSADKGYSSRANAAAIEAVGAKPFIAFKSTAVEPPEGTAWARMYHYFAYQREDFLDHYHQRSNVESAFMMLKSKFGDKIYAKSETGQVNEVLGKVVAHNLCVLIQAIYELGIEVDFTQRTASS